MARPALAVVVYCLRVVVIVGHVVIAQSVVSAVSGAKPCLVRRERAFCDGATARPAWPVPVY